MSKPGPNLFRLVVGIVACANWLVFDSLAQSYPVRPIRMLVGFTSGSAPDVIARALAPMMLEELGQTLVVENRGGGGGAIATEQVAKASADGYTLLLMGTADTMKPALRSKLPYDLAISRRYRWWPWAWPYLRSIQGCRCIT